MSRETRLYAGHAKAYYRAMFDDCRDALFNAAWRQYVGYLKGAIDNPKTEDDVWEWLCTIIGDKVNDSHSPFYIYG